MGYENEHEVLERLRTDLPNFPDEVLEVWLKPYALILGWPPQADRWKRILYMPISCWAKVQWRKENGVLNFEDLEDDSKESINGIINANFGGIINNYSQIPDSKERLGNIIKFVSANGVLPQPMIFLKTGTKLRIVDGNHKTVVYFLYRDSRYRQALPASIIEFKNEQSKWIGEFQSFH